MMFFNPDFQVAENPSEKFWRKRLRWIREDVRADEIGDSGPQRLLTAILAALAFRNWLFKHILEVCNSFLETVDDFAGTAESEPPPKIKKVNFVDFNLTPRLFPAPAARP